jgi:hypothetical protein
MANAGPDARLVARRDPARIPAPRQGESSRRGRRVGAAAVPCHPGRVRSPRGTEARPASRLATRFVPVERGMARRSRSSSLVRRCGRPSTPSTRIAADRDPRRRRHRRPGLDRRFGGGSRSHWRPFSRCPRNRCPRNRWPREARGTRRSRFVAADRRRSAPGEPGHSRVDVLRRGRRGAVRTGLVRSDVVRHVERHVLDHQPEGIRRPPQARAGVPATGAPVRVGRVGPRRRGRGGTERRSSGPARRTRAPRP